MNRDTVRKSTRFAGAVKRYHTWPVLQHQTNADHTYNVIRIWVEIFGFMDHSILEHALYHDTSEIVTGDAPYPVKRDNPDLARAHDRISEACMESLGLGDRPTLDGDALLKLKICDLMEMLEFGLIEWNLGNQFAVPIIRDTLTDIERRVKRLKSHETQRVTEYLSRLKPLKSKREYKNA